MSNQVTPRVPRGMRDYLPQQMIRRQYVISVVREVFESFGFEPLETPVIELEETLLGKYGSEAERLIYSASYSGAREQLRLRYDLSVPLSRVVAMYSDLPKPFRRYQIAPVWRADRPQRGRFREFYQCDVDTVGSSSMLCDAEMVAVIYTVLQRLGFRQFTTTINNRKILNGIGQFAGVPERLLKGLYQAIDKLAKIGFEGVRQELLAVGLPDPIYESLRRVARLYLQEKISRAQLGAQLREEQIPDLEAEVVGPDLEALLASLEPALRALLADEQPGEVEPDLVQERAGQLVMGVTPILREAFDPYTQLIPVDAVDRLMDLLRTRGDNRSLLQALREQLGDYPEALAGIAEIEEMIHFLELLNVPEAYYAVDVSMARGLEYYTGPIYETIVHEANLGSVTGGGRYDELIGLFTERSMPVTGTTIGIERLIVVMEEQDMFPPSISSATSQVLVLTFARELQDESLAAAVMLREAGLRAQVYYEPDPLREQFGYAANKGIPLVIIPGPDEVTQGQLTVRDMRVRRQRRVDRDEVVEVVREWLAEE